MFGATPIGGGLEPLRYILKVTVSPSTDGLQIHCTLFAADGPFLAAGNPVSRSDPGWPPLLDLREELQRLQHGCPPHPAEIQSALRRWGEFLGQQVLGLQILQALRSTSEGVNLTVALEVEEVQPGLPKTEARIAAACTLAQELRCVPWELASDGRIPIADENVTVQTVLGPSAGVSPSCVRPLTIDLDRQAAPLRILFCFALARGAVRLAMRQERVALLDWLARPGWHRHVVQADVLQYGVTRERFRQQMQDSGGYHIIHFSGHGERDRLLFEREDGTDDPITGVEIVQLIRNARVSLPKLVYLSACWTGVAMASALVQCGVFQVIGMRYPVADEYARELACRFYEFLLTGRPASSALALAAQELAVEGRHSPATRFTSVSHGQHDLRLLPSHAIAPYSPVLTTDDLRGKGLNAPPTFVGRDRELTLLGSDWVPQLLSGRRGRGHAVALLIGREEVGKSAVAAEAAGAWRGRFDLTLVCVLTPETTLDRWLCELHDELIRADPSYYEGCQRNPMNGVWFDRETQLYERWLSTVTRNLERVCRSHRLLLVLDRFDQALRTPAGEGNVAALRDQGWSDVLAHLAVYLPATPSRVLITSRWRPAGLYNHRKVLEIPIGELSKEEDLLRLQEEWGQRGGNLEDFADDFLRARLTYGAPASPTPDLPAATLVPSPARPGPPEAASSKTQDLLLERLLRDLVAPGAGRDLRVLTGLPTQQRARFVARLSQFLRERGCPPVTVDSCACVDSQLTGALEGLDREVLIVHGFSPPDPSAEEWRRLESFLSPMKARAIVLVQAVYPYHADVTSGGSVYRPWIGRIETAPALAPSDPSALADRVYLESPSLLSCTARPTQL